MKPATRTISVLAITVLAVISCNNRGSVEGETLSATNAERYPERYIGVNLNTSSLPDEYYDYLLTLDGKYSFNERLLDDCPGTYGEYLDSLLRGHLIEDFLWETGSPMRRALIEVLGYEKFALLYTYFQVTSPIRVIDKWVVINQLWSHAAYRNATVFVDTENQLLYMQWVDPDQDEFLLFYELRDKEEASPATILGRDIPEEVRNEICLELIPDRKLD